MIIQLKVLILASIQEKKQDRPLCIVTFILYLEEKMISKNPRGGVRGVIPSKQKY